MNKERIMAQDELANLKELLSSQDGDLIPHIASDLGSSRYVKNADQIKLYMTNGRILDWGCGIGQMSYLLKNRCFEVISYDVDPMGQEFLDRIGQRLLLARDPVSLPFANSHFDAVLSSGVIEHVDDPLASLKEVNRILKDRGYLFIYRLPNKYSYIEFISDRLGRGDHPVKYSVNEIRGLLEKYNYEVLRVGYSQILPYNLKGFPTWLREFYHRFDKLTEKLDMILSRVPLLKRISTNIEIVARKMGDLT